MANFHQAEFFTIFVIKHRKNFSSKNFLLTNWGSGAQCVWAAENWGYTDLKPEFNNSLHNPCNSCILVPRGSCVRAFVFSALNWLSEHVQTLSTSLSGLYLLEEYLRQVWIWIFVIMSFVICIRSYCMAGGSYTDYLQLDHHASWSGLALPSCTHHTLSVQCSSADCSPLQCPSAWCPGQSALGQSAPRGHFTLGQTVPYYVAPWQTIV